MSYIYLASPYTDKTEVVMERRYQSVMDFTAKMLSAKLWVYSPIVHCHELAKAYGFPRDRGFWEDYNRAMIQPAMELWVLKLPGWEDSEGIKGEIADAGAFSLPIQYVSESWTPSFGSSLRGLDKGVSPSQ